VELIATTTIRKELRIRPNAAGRATAEKFKITDAELAAVPLRRRDFHGDWNYTIESMIEICRDHSRNVKRWQDGKMALRWCAAGMDEARRQFRRVNGHLHMKSLRAALNGHVSASDTTHRYDAKKEAAA
jgi:hypothetical protein